MTLCQFPPWQQPASAAKAVTPTPVARCLSPPAMRHVHPSQVPTRHSSLSARCLSVCLLPPSCPHYDTPFTLLLPPHPIKPLALTLLSGVCLLGGTSLQGPTKRYPLFLFYFNPSTLTSGHGRQWGRTGVKQSWKRHVLSGVSHLG